jgi:hypothetical protein
MKTSALVLGAILSLSAGHALAYPGVGDEAKYAGTSKKGTDPEKAVELSMKVVNWDATDKEWDVQIDMTVDGKTTSKVEDIDEDRMWSPTMWTKVQSECVAKGGVLEDVTVVAGTFASCHKTKVWGTKTVEMWWADIPFGLVKMSKVNTDPAKLSEERGELQSYTAAP